MKKKTYKGVAKAMVLKPLFRQRVVKDKTKYTRKVKHPGRMLDQHQLKMIF